MAHHALRSRRLDDKRSALAACYRHGLASAAGRRR